MVPCRSRGKWGAAAPLGPHGPVPVMGAAAPSGLTALPLRCAPRSAPLRVGCAAALRMGGCRPPGPHGPPPRCAPRSHPLRGGSPLRSAPRPTWQRSGPLALSGQRADGCVNSGQPGCSSQPCSILFRPGGMGPCGGRARAARGCVPGEKPLRGYSLRPSPPAPPRPAAPRWGAPGSARLVGGCKASPEACTASGRGVRTVRQPSRGALWAAGVGCVGSFRRLAGPREHSG